MATITAEHRVGGEVFAIYYDEARNEWATVWEGERVAADSLAKVKAKLKHKVEGEKTRQRIPVLTNGRYSSGTFVEGAATSLTDNNGFVRVTLANGEREQIPARNVYANTPENRAVVAEHERLMKQQKALDQQLRDAMAKLVPLDISKLKAE